VDGDFAGKRFQGFAASKFRIKNKGNGDPKIVEHGEANGKATVLQHALALIPAKP
jgi:hypothetical protein